MDDHPLVAHAERTCYACPEQWKGQLHDGQYFYFRYRSGWASLGIGPDIDAAVGDRQETGQPFGDSLQGLFERRGDRNTVFNALLMQHYETGRIAPAPPVS